VTIFRRAKTDIIPLGVQPVSGRINRFKGAANTVEILAQIAAGGLFAAARPELECKPAAINALSAV